MADDTDEPSTRDILADAKKAFEVALEAENQNRDTAAEDLRFARLGEQWPEHVRKQRETDFRPCHTINRLPAFIRQVVNDARQNKPSIKVHPADSGADPETADIINGLIRNIEYTSNAEVAYDTATESAVSMGWGYLKVDIDYAYDDTFDMDIRIERVSDPFSIYGDPYSKEADSSDWNSAFETEWLTKDDFKQQFPGFDPADWDNVENREHWFNGDQVMIAKWWEREEVERTVVLLSDGRTFAKDELMEPIAPEYPEITGLDVLASQGVTVVKERESKSWRVRRHTLTGGDVLKSEDWPGCYIPIIPVYGDEVVDEKGVRHLRSLICDAKDSQRDYNYWRTTATELVALAPRVPFIGPKGSFRSDRNWRTANTGNHPFLEYDVVAGGQSPQRQPLDSGPAAGALQQAANAADDIKAIIGIYDPGLGARSNETSGKAIIARQRESDVSTFHFQDNMSRAIRHTGRILIDLIPKIYSTDRIIRIIGEDGTADNIPLKQPVPVKGQDGQLQMQPAVGENGQPIIGPDGKQAMKPVTRIYDLTIGKYDLTVASGPSYTTRREEAAMQMFDLLRAMPQAAPLIGDLLAKNLDWPGADEIAKRLKTMLPPQLNGGLPPEVQQMIEQGKEQIGQQQQMIQQMQAYILKLEADRTANMKKAETGQYDAETKRLDVLADIQAKGTPVPDVQGSQYPDYDGIVAAAKANQFNATAEKERANAGLATAKTLRELRPPEPQFMPMTGIPHASAPRRQF